MQVICRRAVLGSITALALPIRGRAATLEELSVDAEESSVALTRYAMDRDGKRAVVLVLHGGRGVELKPLAYERHAKALSAAAIDAYLVRYFTDADRAAFDPKTSTPESRDAYCTGRFEGWVRRISSVVTAVLARPESSGRIGLLGFSLGGYVAADTAADDDRIAALAVMYGGIPDAMVTHVKHMPPLLELHGDADHNVPLAKGKELVELAKAAGAPAEQIVYPGRAHGFDFSDTDPATANAIGRVVQFFEAQMIDDRT
jgi:carboxymethylenebutenolidase